VRGRLLVTRVDQAEPVVPGRHENAVEMPVVQREELLDPGTLEHPNE
jgi:hypothetical protein